MTGQSLGSVVDYVVFTVDGENCCEVYLMDLVVRVSCACGRDVTDIELCGAAFHSHWILRVGEWFSYHSSMICL